MNRAQLDRLEAVLKDFEPLKLRTTKQSREAVRCLVEQPLKDHHWLWNQEIWTVYKVKLTSTDGWGFSVELQCSGGFIEIPLTQFMDQATIYE